ncbi:uncharacterized protein [Panulirus ornatus]|uniref:uncharacterized protein n=1 Tax=Panulirus ornatus TaxID=150431 RepID=UPI003A854C28
MHSQFLACVVLFASLAAALPQGYHAEGVLEVDSGDLGPHDRLVAATIDILPEIAEVLERVQTDTFPVPPERQQEIVDEFIPLTRKIVLAQAKAEGRNAPKDALQRINAIEAVMPSVNNFMNRMRDINLFGLSSDIKYESYER